MGLVVAGLEGMQRPGVPRSRLSVPSRSPRIGFKRGRAPAKVTFLGRVAGARHRKWAKPLIRLKPHFILSPGAVVGETDRLILRYGDL